MGKVAEGERGGKATICHHYKPLLPPVAATVVSRRNVTVSIFWHPLITILYIFLINIMVLITRRKIVVMLLEGGRFSTWRFSLVFSHNTLVKLGFFPTLLLVIYNNIIQGYIINY